MTFSGKGAFTLNGNAVTLGSDIIDYNTNTQTINLPVTLVGGSRTFNVYAVGDNMKVTGGIGENGGNYGINKTGSGTLTLSRHGHLYGRHHCLRWHACCNQFQRDSSRHKPDRRHRRDLDL